MRTAISVALALVATSAGVRGSAQIALSALDDGARVEPVGGTIVEADWIPESLGPGRGYLAFNPVFDADRRSIELRAARNETVAFQVVVEALAPPVHGVDVDLGGLSGPTDLVRGREIKLYREWYVHLPRISSSTCTGGAVAELGGTVPTETTMHRLVNSFGTGWYPDALLPLDGPLARAIDATPLSIPDSRNSVPGQRLQAFWVDVWVPEEAPPGVYRGDVVVSWTGGRAVLPVELVVIPVTLPDTFHAGLGSVSYDFVGHTLARRGPHVVHDLFRLLHAHRFTVDALYLRPDWDDGRIDWTRYDALVGPALDGSAFGREADYHGPGRDQPVRRFLLPVDWNWPVTPDHSRYDETFVDALRAVERHIIERRWTETEWSLFINSTDEPRTLEAFEEIRRYGKRLGAAKLARRDLVRYRIDAGQFKAIGRVLSGWNVNRIFDEIGEVVDIWNCCGGVPFVPASELGERLRTHPDEQAWFYFSCTAGEPAVGSILIDGEALGPRTWGWIVWKHGLSAGVSWELGWPSANCLSQPDCAGYGMHGDASLVYLADALGVEEAVLPSIRLKGLRRGADDHEYLVLLAERGLRDLASAYATRLVPRALDDRLVSNVNGAWVHDPAVWEEVRREMGLVLAGELEPPDPATVAAAAPPFVVPAGVRQRKASTLAGAALVVALVLVAIHDVRRRR